MSLSRVKVELRDCPLNASKDEKDRAFKQMLHVFRRKVNESGILSLWKKKQYYESPSETRRKKKREQESNKRKLKSHFVRGGE